MRRTDQPLLPDEVLAVKDHIVAAFAAMDGRFDDRIEELRKIKADIDAKARIVGSAEDAKKTREAADQYLADQKGKADVLMKDVESARAKVDAQEGALAARAESVRTGEAKLLSDQAAFNGSVEANNQRVSQTNAKLADRERASQTTLDDLARRETALRKREIELAEKIERLRAASTGI